jgi:prepilin-type processing-associated H-X9-DG protein
MYVHDHNDALPLNSIIPVNGSLASGQGSWVLGNAMWDTTTSNLQEGALYGYLRGPGVYHCPSDKSTVSGHKDLPRTRSYSLSGFLNVVDPRPGIDWSPSSDPNDKSRYPQLLPLSPARLFAFVDEQEHSIDDGVMIVRSDFYGHSNEWYDLPADRHAQGCNLSFTDGHWEGWRWKWPKQFTAHPQPEANPEDHKDVYRLRACCPLGR